MVIDLAQVIGEVSCEMNQVIPVRQPLACDRLGELGLELRRSAEPGPYGCTRGIDLLEQLRAGHAPAGELRRTIPNVSRPAKKGTEVVLQVSREVQDEGSGDVGDPRHLLPQRSLVGIGLHLPPERPQVAIEDACNPLEQQRGAQWLAP